MEFLSFYFTRTRVDPSSMSVSRPILLLIALCSAMVAVALSGGASAKTGQPLVVTGTIDGVIDPVQLRYVEQVLDTAEREDADAVLFSMDTPGGLSTSMNSIIKKFISDEQKIPVIVWVGPRGSEAASAGMYITFAADIAAMAPATNIGSATPIQGSGKDIGGDLRRKVINNSVVQVKNLQKDHGRDTKFAERAVRKADNIDSDEALKMNVIDVQAKSIRALLDQIDGRVTKPKGIKMNTKDAAIKNVEKSITLKILAAVINPNLVFLLFSAGLLGLAFEITHPGTILPGVVGALCFITALFGLQVLPITATGVILLIIAVVLFIAEAFVISHGVLGLGGAVAFFLGGLMLFQSDSGLGVDIPVLIVVALTLGGFFTIILRKAMEVRRAPQASALDYLVGKTAVVRTEFNPMGQVFVNGELWGATCIAEGLAVGDSVTITGVTGLTLSVEPTPSSDQPPTNTPTEVSHG